MVSSRLTATVIAPDRLDTDMVAAWDQLNGVVPALASPFMSVGFVRAVQRAGRHVRVCVILRDGRPCAFFPFEFAGTMAGILRAGTPVGAGMSDYVGLVAPADFRITTAELLQLARLSTFTFSHLDETQLAYGLTAEQPRTGLRFLPDATDPLGALARTNGKYMKDSDRCARLLAKDIGEVTFSFDQHAGRRALLDQLIAFKRAQYVRTGVQDALAAQWTRDLLYVLAELESPHCSGRLSTLYAGEQWVASHFGLVSHNTLHHWMPVYNPDFSRYAPGRLLMHHMIAACPGLGLLAIDHGEGDSPAKRQVSNEEHSYLRGAWHDSSLMSVASRGYQSLLWRLQG